MGPLIRSGERLLVFVALLTLSISATYAQSQPASAECIVTAVPAMVRSEGLTERMGDLVLQCSSSTPGAVITGNYTLTLPISITNRIGSNNLTTDTVLYIDYGIGFTPSSVAGLVSGNSIAFNGVSITVPSSGNFNVKFSNLRGDVHQSSSAPVPVLASLSAPLQLNQAQIVVANASPGLYATLYNTGVRCTGSQLPANLDLTDLFAAKTAFFSTRVTEGFGGAFLPQGAGETNGTRFLVTYSGFPANATLYVPDYVAGSDATTPTAGGDLGLPQAVGEYLPGSGALLLALVEGADATGTGGSRLAAPTGTTPVALNSVTQVPLTNGAGYAVYEVIAANPTLIGSAQFPTFLGLPHVNAPAMAQETISLAPVSTVTTASSTDPVPRFAAVTPASDCKIVGDCQAPYFPKLNVFNEPVQLSATAGGGMTSHGYIYVQNVGGGIMSWGATATYVGSATGWLTLYEPTNLNSATITVSANPQGLAAGTYQAKVVIDAGPLAGNATIPVTLTVQPGPEIVTQPASAVTVSSVVNAATFAVTPLVAGSLGTVKGSNLAGMNVSAAFDGLPATLLYTSATQINLQVPPGLGNKTAASLVVTVNGTSSAPVTVQFAPAWPAIFGNGVLNQDNSGNSASTPAPAGTILQIFATGIPTGAAVTAQIGSQSGLVPLYAGPAPSLTGVQQVNVAVPAGLPPQTTQVTLCAAVSGQQYCSPANALYTD